MNNFYWGKLRISKNKNFDKKMGSKLLKKKWSLGKGIEYENIVWFKDSSRERLY